MRTTLLLTLGLALAGCSAPTELDDVAASTSAILGGRADTQHRAVLALTHPMGATRYGLCTASVFHVTGGSAWLVTAAHCVVKSDDQGDIVTPPAVLPAEELRASASAVVEGDRLLEREYPVVGVTVAPGYNGFLGNPDDVAIVQIAGVASDFPRLPLLSQADAPAEVSEPVTLVGFGRTETNDTGARRVTTQSIAWQDPQFIGFDQSSGQGVCQGDSGGPVLLQRRGGDVIAAVNSLAKGTQDDACIENGTSVRLDRHAKLIEQAFADTPASLECGSCKLAARAPGSACAERVACEGDCAKLVSCVEACSDRSCVAECALLHADGLEQHRAELRGAASCAEQACSEPCRVIPGAESKSDGCSYSTPRGDGTWLMALALVAWSVAWRRGRP